MVRRIVNGEVLQDVDPRVLRARTAAQANPAMGKFWMAGSRGPLLFEQPRWN